ncbi:MAG: Bug family tripartite tricarboxylate transporter substrate binding protein [Burkholderiales bacterium]
MYPTALRIGLIALCCTLCQLAAAQTYPAKPVRMIVTFAPGGGADFVGRVIGQKLSDALGQPVVIDNRAGANGTIGNEAVAKSAPDGYTLLLGAAGPLTIAPHLYAKLPFDTLRDYAPVALAASSAFAVTLHPSVPANSVKELIALARARPDKLNYGSSGTGGAPHLATVLFASTSGITLNHVPYKGLAPALTDLMGGQVDLLFADVGLVVPHRKAGKLKALAVTADKRSSVMRDVPTVAESGLAGYQTGTWYGILAPTGTSADIIARLNQETMKVLALPEVKERFLTQGIEPAGSTPAQFAAYMRSELNKWEKVIKAGGIKVE